MKKIDALIIGGLTLAALTLIPIPPKSVETETPASVEAAAVDPVTAKPMYQTEDLLLRYVDLDENTKDILDEVLCDYVSEEVVNLMEQKIDYHISSNWVERRTHTYLFFEKQLPEGPSYTACGYVQKTDGSYAYFELSSPRPLTEEIVDTEILKAFAKPVQPLQQFC